MKVYIVVRIGVYDQGIVGVYDSNELAHEATGEAQNHEPDDYHDFETREYVLNNSENLDTGWL